MSKHYRSKFLLSLAVLAVTLLLQATPALAPFTTHFYTTYNRSYACVVCCSASYCTTSCG